VVSGLLSGQQHEVEEVPTPGRGPKEQHPVTEKQIAAIRLHAKAAAIKLPPGPTPVAPIKARIIPNNAQSIAAPARKTIVPTQARP